MAAERLLVRCGKQMPAVPDQVEQVSRALDLADFKRPEEAYDLLLQVVRGFPKWGKLHYHLAWVCCLLEAYKEAELWLSKAIELDRFLGDAAHGDPEVEAVLKRVRKRVASARRC